VLVLHRADDMAVPVGHGRHLAGMVPQARYVELPGRDHAPWVGDMAALVELIRGFAQAPDSGASGIDEVLTTVLAVRDIPEAVVREEAGRWRGRAMRAQDGLGLVVFDGPARAVRCGLALLLRVPSARAGVHSGNAAMRGDDVSGPAPRIGRAVAQAAAAGEILVTATVRDLVAGAGLAFVQRGDIRLAEPPGAFALLAAR